MTWVGRHVVSVVIVSAAALVTTGLFLLRPQYSLSHGHGTTVKLPAKRPALDASGARGWVWADGTPGWTSTQRVDGFLVAGLQPVELDAARLAAARAGLDSQDVRVIASIRGSKFGVLAILAAPTLDEAPTKTCLAALLERNAPVKWQCPGSTISPSDLEHSHVLVAATSYAWPNAKGGEPLYLVGVARGDVYRVAIAVDGKRPETLYRRGETWGQFTDARTVKRVARLEIFGKRGLVETLPLRVRPGRQRVFR